MNEDEDDFFYDDSDKIKLEKETLFALNSNYNSLEINKIMK